MIALAMLAQTATAGPVVAAEVVNSFQLGNESVELGTGVGLRAGLPLDIVIVELVPELGVTMWLSDPALVVPELGARFSVGKILEPGAYGHVLFPLREGSQTGWDAGLSLDLTAIPKVDIGVQGGLLGLGGSPGLQVGGHLAIKF